jgi:hypothetical protein
MKFSTFAKKAFYTEGSFDFRFRMCDFGKCQHPTSKIRNILRDPFFDGQN